MIRILLTSTGFDNKKFEKIFCDNMDKPMDSVKVVFVPTAANDEESRSVVPFCKQDLTNAGIPEENIVTYDLDRKMDFDEIYKYDAIYFCGGSEEYLIERVHAMEFAPVLLKAVENGLFYIGVSAGSMIASSSVKDNLGIIKNPLEPHCEKNITPCGRLLNNSDQIRLSDTQAVWITDDTAEIIE